MDKLTFIIHEAEEGGYHAEAIDIGIFAEGETLREIAINIASGIECYYDASLPFSTILNKGV